MDLDKVLSFWFEKLGPKAWWLKSPEIDQEIRTRFEKAWLKACMAELYHWRDSSRGRLAEIILLDQFSRNIYRNNPKAFTQDPMALALSQEALRIEADEDLNSLEKVFLYMPFMHSESKLIQAQSVGLFSKLGIKENLKFAAQHKAIIDRFGHFPHRNKILGRASTDEELEFLKLPNSSF